MNPTPLLRRAALCCLALLSACGGGGGSAPPVAAPASSPASAPTGPARATAQPVRLTNPWGLAQLPDGSWLVTQRTAGLVRVAADLATSQPVTGAPAVDSAGQGGLLDVALDPDFATTGHVFLSYAEPGSGAEAGKAGTAVARAQLVGNALQGLTVIFRQAPKVAGGAHYGSRLVFARDKTLFITLGERQLGSPAQDVAQTLGKVVRVNRDGSMPADNPSFGAGARPGLWSMGHRNPQGAALHPTTGELWVSEHGAQGGDEINIARAGGNHGWPTVSYGCNYGDPVGTACAIGGGVHAPRFVEPLTWWVPTSIAPSGIAFYGGAMFPEWQGNLFVGALAGQALWRLTLSGDTVASREKLFEDLGERIRAVRPAPDGALLLLTDSGKLIRIAR
ncbi:PQQ-dependent sugar dehydrogenase [Roseateles sp. DXS20W]|uniref:PQQ-dependent sugar dehydrogenase n=1 Tax=Pelomonas lactea TaxID=3299030 RepID=A0ABW7GEG3_9BURK